MSFIIEKFHPSNNPICNDEIVRQTIQRLTSEDDATEITSVYDLMSKLNIYDTFRLSSPGIVARIDEKERTVYLYEEK